MWRAFQTTPLLGGGRGRTSFVPLAPPHGILAQVARPLVEAWVGSVGLKCECADYVPPAKRPRGRPW